MSKFAVLLCATLAGLSGCKDNPATFEGEKVGRFQYFPASGDMPAVLLDTATGCLERLERLTSLENAKHVEWRRQYMDGVWPVMIYGNNGLPSPVPNSEPPKRCPKPAGAAK